MQPTNPEFSRDGVEQDRLALASMSLRQHDELVAYRADGGVDIHRFIETGETRLRTIGLGKGGPSISFETNVAEPLLDAEFDSIAEYVASLPGEGRGDAYDIRKELLETQIDHDKTFDELAKDIVSYAKHQTERSSNESEQCDTCTNCKGEQRTFNCFCMEGGSSYTDLEGDTVHQRTVGEADPDCSTCEGSGRYSPACPTCRGCGEVIINPLVSLINDETGETSGFRLNIARLIADGEVDLGISKPSEPRSWMKGVDHLVVTVDLRPLLAKKSSAIGIDMYRDDFHTLWGQEPLELWATTLGHLLKPVEAMIPMIAGNKMSSENMAQLLKELQECSWRDLRSDIYGIDLNDANAEQIREHGKVFDLDFNERLLVKAYGLRLSNIMPASRALQELIGILNQYNYRLGFTYTGIATGETGPALFLLDQAGNILQQLDAGYDERYVLEIARRKIKSAHDKGEIKVATEFKQE